jgi:hypothetical protein
MFTPHKIAHDGPTALATIGNFKRPSSSDRINDFISRGKKIKSSAEAHTGWDVGVHHTPSFMQDHKYLTNYLMLKIAGRVHRANNANSALFMREVNPENHPSDAEVQHIRRHEFFNPQLMNMYLYNRFVNGEFVTPAQVLNEWSMIGASDTRDFESVDDSQEAKLNAFFRGYGTIGDYWGGSLRNMSTIGFIVKKMPVEDLPYDEYSVTESGDVFKPIEKNARIGEGGEKMSHVTQIVAWSHSLPNRFPLPQDLCYLDNDGRERYGEFINMGVTESRDAWTANKHLYWDGSYNDDEQYAIARFRATALSNIKDWLRGDRRVLDVFIYPRHK